MRRFDDQFLAGRNLSLLQSLQASHTSNLSHEFINRLTANGLLRSLLSLLITAELPRSLNSISNATLLIDPMMSYLPQTIAFPLHQTTPFIVQRNHPSTERMPAHFLPSNQPRSFASSHMLANEPSDHLRATSKITRV